MGLLKEIVEHKRIELAERRLKMPVEELKKSIKKKEFAFGKALLVGRTNIIAEVKRASPSAGVIVEDYRPAQIAQTYQDSGAAAVSVITDEKYFGGSLSDLREVSSVLRVPVLRKDFIIDEYQIYESAAGGASAVLLIAGILSAEELRGLKQSADSCGLDSLVEVHSEEELIKALSVSAGIIGVNNRNLDTLQIDLAVSERIAKIVPKGICLISESGIKSFQDVRRLKHAGIKNFLVGENILKSSDISLKIKELIDA